MPDIDLIIAGGTVVSPTGRVRADVAIDRGIVRAVGHADLTASRVVDASGLLVMPGGVDTHVHLMDPGSTDREDFPTGTAAAAAAGVTTIIEHSHGRPVRTVEDLTAKREYLRGRAQIDYGLAAHAWPGLTDVDALWNAGAAFFKVFTCTTHGVPGHSAAALKDHLDATVRAGAVSLVHCEDESLTESAEQLLKSQGRIDSGLLPEWRSLTAELVAVAVASLLIRRSDARAAIAHVSTKEVANYIAAERGRGAHIAAEACPQYFLLRESDVLEHGNLRKFTPPARARIDADEIEMWRLLREGVLTHMSSDHAPSTLAQKSGAIWDVHFGLPGIDSTMSILLDAASRGYLSYEDVTRVYSEAPAKHYGLWPRKGRLAVGADADVILVDPTAKRTLSNDEVISKAGWTPFAGRTVTGRVLETFSRGVSVAREGIPVGAGEGQFVAGAGARD
jgi:dihydroorotase (multifunctional complex type)